MSDRTNRDPGQQQQKPPPRKKPGAAHTSPRGRPHPTRAWRRRSRQRPRDARANSQGKPGTAHTSPRKKLAHAVRRQSWQRPREQEPTPKKSPILPASDKEEANKASPSPSLIVSLGVGLLLILGILWGLKEIKREPPLSPTGLSFQASFRSSSDLWPVGSDAYKLGSLSLTDDGIYRAEVYTINVMLLAYPQTPIPTGTPTTESLTEEPLERCLVVQVAMDSGQPETYGIAFHGTDEKNFDLFTIDEGGQKAYFETVRDCESTLFSSQHIGNILQDIPAGQPRRISLVIGNQEILAWLDSQPTIARKGENLTSGWIGLFVMSGSQTETLPIRLSFSNLQVSPLSLNCWP